MKYVIFDIETDGLLDDLTKLHCLSYRLYNDKELIHKSTLTEPNEINTLFRDCDKEGVYVVGHNIIQYDFPALYKLFKIEKPSNIIDTLPLSWYLYSHNTKHGLEYWGELLEVPKPIIKDWSNLSLEDYKHRCETDVEINSLLWFKLLGYLEVLYNKGNYMRLIKYLNFKMDCSREQEEVKIKLDLDLINKSLKELYPMRSTKINTLTNAMPPIIKYKTIRKPKNTFRKDGTLSSLGIKWHNTLVKNNLPDDYEGEILEKIGEEKGNPDSKLQLKQWLFSLGWKPKIFKDSKSISGEIKKVPQIHAGEEVCDSVKELFLIEPALEALNSLSIINHRIKIFEAFLECQKDGYVTSTVSGLSNTLRWKHSKPCVNLPKPGLFYGDEIRGSITVPNDDYIMCGSDMSALEDTTKQHYIYFFDPEYVSQMRTPGFDPHLDIAQLANLLTPEQVEEHKKGIKSYKKERSIAKSINFSAVYGAGPPKIAESISISLEEATKIHKTYWERNKAVKQTANAFKKKVTNYDGITQMWLLNPISKLWISLRYEKDAFSSGNQSSGSQNMPHYIVIYSCKSL